MASSVRWCALGHLFSKWNCTHFLGGVAPRPKTLTELIVRMWEYERDYSNVASWATPGESLDASTHVNSLGKWWWSSTVAFASTSLRHLLAETQTFPNGVQMCLPVLGATRSLVRALQMKPASGNQQQILLAARAKGMSFQEVHFGRGFKI